MTDKQIIETFRNIKEYCCDFNKDCSWCHFEIKGTQCQIRKLALSLAREIPKNWDMDEIERIINETD